MSDRVNYGPADVRTVKRAMDEHIGPDRAATWKEIAAEMELRDDRKLRQIASDYDGDAMLLAKNDDGVFLAENAEQAASFQAELEAKIWTLLKRRSRRKRYARAMSVRPVEQLRLEVA